MQLYIKVKLDITRIKIQYKKILELCFICTDTSKYFFWNTYSALCVEKNVANLIANNERQHRE